MRLSIVVPVYNEEESLDILHVELTRTLKAMSCDYEIIMIDDGSHDASGAKLKALAGVISPLTPK